MQSFLVIVPLLVVFGVILLVVKFIPSKNRSNGVTIIAVWFLLLSLFAFRYQPIILGITVFAIFVGVGIGLLKLYKPARIAAMVIWAVLFVIQLFGVAISLLAINQKLPEAAGIDLSKETAQLIVCGFVSIGLFYFFTRSRIKEQFDKGLNESQKP